MPPLPTLDYILKEDFIIFRLKGKIDTMEASHLDKSIRSLLPEGPVKILLNLEQIQYISSAGVRLLISLHKEIQKRKGILILGPLSFEAQHTLSLIGLQTLFRCVSSEEEGIAQLKQ